MDNWKDNKNVFWTLAGPGTFWLLVFFILPLGFLFVMSFSDKAMINGEISITDTIPTVFPLISAGLIRSI